MPISPSTYLLASIAVGAAQVGDAIALAKFKGRAGAIAIAFSFFEYVWAVVSFLVWRSPDESVPRWLPASFVAYVALFFVAGVAFYSRQQSKEIIAPPHLVVAGGAFGFYFAMASAWCLF